MNKETASDDPLYSELYGRNLELVESSSDAGFSDSDESDSTSV